MNMWLGIILGAMAFAGTAFADSSADYIGLLGYYPPPDPDDVEPVLESLRDPPPPLRLIGGTAVLANPEPTRRF